MKKKDIFKRLNRIHDLVYNDKNDYSNEPCYPLDVKDRKIDRLLRRIEHVCNINNKICG